MGQAGRGTAGPSANPFGGIKIGSAFFGWLAATGMAVLLTALVAAAGTAVGLATNTDVNAAVSFARLLHVHRSGDVGSPRVTGCTKASNAAVRPGWI